ncbi:MAG: beta-ketoacyl synthase N-terminal-like domain-containing protein [Desulfobacterales bacterium]|nr:beta-ketoacyl synthase N-terminal-like domain-containing protein [Desulfobacterales bacterium]MDX2512959.1 beta-ketoacyl synthase N-terminal-like domain-containing protein [Desulfobacterales bacterium]
MTAISITGMGVISSLGVGREAFWEGCLAARSGFRQITAFDTDSYSTNVGACVVDFKPADFMPPMTYRRMSRISRMAVAASIEAVDDSGLCLDRMNRERVAVVMGTSYGSSSHVDGFYRSLLADGPRGAQPLLFPETVPNAPASYISIYHNIQGPNATFCQNEISAETGLAYARSLLDQNIVDVVLLGGAEELSEILFGCYDAVGGLNKIRVNEGEGIQPKPGSGLILGEGAAVLVMERRESARQRGAKLYGSLVADVIAGGVSAMGHYAMKGQPIARTIVRAMEKAGIKPGDIDHISVSANYAKELDPMEFEQVASCFQPSDGELWVSPLKYLIGDFGAAGTTRAAAVLLSLYHQISLPALPISTLKMQEKKPLEWRPYERGTINNALMTGTTFGGGTASLIFSR